MTRRREAIFDLNGVFIKSPSLSKRFEHDFGILTKQFLPALSDIMTIVRQPGAGDIYEY